MKNYECEHSTVMCSFFFLKAVPELYRSFPMDGRENRCSSGYLIKKVQAQSFGRWYWSSQTHISKRTITEYCKDFGVESVHHFTSCEGAWKHLKDQEVDLLILDWFAKGSLTPIGLFNRIKNPSKSTFFPIVITSGFAKT